jgi:hypothetical protein
VTYTSDWGGPEPLEDEDGVLHRVVLDQTAAQLAIPVLLLTDEVLVPDAAGGEAATPEEAAALQEVTRLASDLGVDLDDLALFSADAYLLQCALGQAALSADPERR